MPRAPRKEPVRLSIRDCQAMAKLAVDELRERGWIAATFETYDGRSVHGGQAEAASAGAAEVVEDKGGK